MTEGKYIVIEGAEGVGKTTMVQMLGARLQAERIPFKIMREPDSQNDLTARAIRRLTQDPQFPMNTRTEVLLFNAARSQSLEIIRHLRANGVTCLVDRNYLTTLANQYYGRGDVQDYQKINEIIDFAVGDMQPDLTLVLDAPVQTLRERIETRPTSHGRFGDLDEGFYERVRAGYLWEANQRNLPVIYATDPAETVFNSVWQHVSTILPVRSEIGEGKPQSVAEVLAANPPAKSTAVEPPIIGAVQTAPAKQPEQSAPAPREAEATPTEPWTHKHDNGSVTVTDAGKAELAKYTTNTEGSVYGFTDAMSPITVAAAMARLSRRGDDMRVTLLDEFIGKADKDAQLLHRVITAFGDDSVQQLVGQHFVYEGASILLTKKLEWGRLAAYLEQSTRYIYFDQKDANGKYRYYVPPELKGKPRSQYIRTMNQIFDTYSELVQDMTAYIRKSSAIPKAEQDGAWRAATKAQACDAVRDLLPLATKATVGMFVSGQALESLIMHLLSDDLPEARNAGELLLAEGRKVIPAFLERADKPDRGGAIVAYRANTHHKLQQLSRDLLPSNHTVPTRGVTLTSYTPHNELEIVADMLYEYSDLSLGALQQEVSSWPYDRKLDVFTAYMGERLNRRQRPGRALEKIHYSFDMVVPYSVFKDLQRHRMVDDQAWQEFNPRLGYDIPKLVEEAGLSDKYEQCFDLSLELHSALQAAKGSLIAQYAVLQGHHIRWKVTLNARQAFQMLELRSSPQGHPAYRKVAQQMHAKIAEVHPQIAEAMIFMNKGEDPELARLAAEKYTQYKLAKLDSTKAQE